MAQKLNLENLPECTDPQTPTPTRMSRLPDITSALSVRFSILQKGYLSYFSSSLIMTLLFIPVLGMFTAGVLTADLTVYLEMVHIFVTSISISAISLSILLAIVILVIFFMQRPKTIYLREFTTYKAPENLLTDKDAFMMKADSIGVFDEVSMEFQRKIIAKSAIGPSAFPPGILAEPPQISMEMARQEAEEVMFTCVSELLEKTGLSPRQIDILIVNCSLFCPTPSLSAMIINKFKMRSNIISYNLGGMGCSAGVISIDLAKRLLESSSGMRAVVVSTENITQNWYLGNDRSMLVSNTLFRMGGAAILLSNKFFDGFKSKFKLLHTVRTHKGADDECFKCVYQKQDDKGITGVSLSKKVMQVASDALKTNITTLGPLTLPFSEQFNFFLNLCGRKLVTHDLPDMVPGPVQKAVFFFSDFLLAFPEDSDSIKGWINIWARSFFKLPTKKDELRFDEDKPIKIEDTVGKSYVPDFTKAFQHFCVHAGGRGVIDAIEKNLKLPPHYLDASRATLYKYGNTSSSSIWYEMQYHENHSDMKSGDRCWQIAFGSGFKCNSAVWQKI